MAALGEHLVIMGVVLAWSLAVAALVTLPAGWSSWPAAPRRGRGPAGPRRALLRSQPGPVLAAHPAHRPGAYVCHDRHGGVQPVPARAKHRRGAERRGPGRGRGSDGDGDESDAGAPARRAAPGLSGDHGGGGAGIRLAAISTIGIATIAATINAGGLGTILFSGLRTMNVYKIVDGTVLCAAVALVADVVLKGIEKLVTKRISR